MGQDAEQDILALDALPDGGLLQVEVDGAKLLLTRQGEAVRAFSAICPHAGGPLLEGVRNADRIVCPWHKATFCLRTGRVLEPPAVDGLQPRPARVQDGRIMLGPAAGHGDAGATFAATDARCFVIVGGGAAGGVAAQTLREEGFAGRVVILDEANRVPYDRTVLSKYHLSGEKGGEKTPLQPQSWWQAQGIERRTADIVRLDAGARRIECADGQAYTYDAALLATGAVPNRPALLGMDLPHVFVLRSRADADAILAQAERSARAVVLGASFIGMEAAASLRERGLEVTVVAKETAPFAKQLGAQIGEIFERLHRQRGVAFRLGSEIAAIEPGWVRLGSGEAIAADLVVVGFGVRPATAFLEGVALNKDGGVPVDAGLRAADGLWAAGDIAAFPLRGDGPRIRVEHWRVAEQHGRVAALNMLGRDIPYAAPPVFWTIQYLKRLDYIGHAEEWDGIVLHGDASKPEFLAYYVKDGRVAAAAGLARDQDTAALVELFAARRDWTPDQLGEHPARMLAAGARAV